MTRRKQKTRRIQRKRRGTRRGRYMRKMYGGEDTPTPTGAAPEATPPKNTGAKAPTNAKSSAVQLLLAASSEPESNEESAAVFLEKLKQAPKYPSDLASALLASSNSGAPSNALSSLQTLLAKPKGKGTSSKFLNALLAAPAPSAAPVAMALPAAPVAMAAMALPEGPPVRTIPQFIPFPTSVPKAFLTPYLQYITELSELQQYTITQYTFHGDVMLNAFSRGIDTIDTYKNNIPTPETVEARAHHFELSCLFLYILAPDLAANEYFKVLYPKLHRVAYYQLDIRGRYMPYIMNSWDESVIGTNFRRTVPSADFIAHKDSVFRRYRSEIYPELKAQLDAGNLNYFREKTYEALKIIFGAIQPIPTHIPYSPLDPPRKVYRGVNNFYLPLDRQPFIINSFLSSSLDKVIANQFADAATGGIYEFIFYTDVPVLYLGSLSRFPNEYEMLFCPGVRLMYVRSITDADGYNTRTYVILKPDETIPVGTTLPDTYDDYRAWEQSLEVYHPAIAPGAAAIPVPIAPVAQPVPVNAFNYGRNAELYMGGGLNSKRNKTYKKLNRTGATRKNKHTMPQPRVSIPGDRWDSKLPIKYQVTELTAEDKETIARMNAYLARSEKR